MQVVMEPAVEFMAQDCRVARSIGEYRLRALPVCKHALKQVCTILSPIIITIIIISDTTALTGASRR
jgi:hypothetical protein